MNLNSSRRRIDVTRKDFGYFKLSLSTNQTTNITTADHVKFAVIGATNRGDKISLDTTTAYTNTANVASIGRFTLKGGACYELRAALYQGVTSAQPEYQWWNADTNTAIPDSVPAINPAMNAGTGNNASPEAFAIFAPSVDTRVELRLTAVPGLSSIIYTNSWAYIQAIDSFMPINRDILKAKYTYEKSSGTNGGAVTASAWTKYPFDDTPKQNDRNFSAMSSSVLTLVKGKYRIYVGATFYQTNATKLRLRNTSDSATVDLSLSTYSVSSDQGTPNPTLHTKDFEITSTKTFEIQYYVSNNPGAQGFGTATSSGENEVYGELIIERIE